ncbi:HAMP domain-containing sensor histidine kinase [Streptomyces sp. NPDC020875]|uniref:sensor histidine kinase n=1 Tax=Streptomyces sp. NPDC020875 TaxID=3154898 RepID=UPI0033C97CF1
MPGAGRGRWGRAVGVRLTARSRLALLSTGLVLVAGALLSALTFLLVRRNLEHRWVVRVDRAGPPSAGPTGTPGAGASAPAPAPAPAPADADGGPVVSGADLPRLPGRDELADAGRRIRADALSELITQAATALVVVTVLTAVLAWFLAGRVLRPLRTVAATARRLSAENLADRVPVRRPDDELAALARTINDMLDRVERGVVERGRILESQRMFAANAAHELRTPLTTIRTAVDVTLDGDPARDELLTMAEDIRNAVAQGQRTLDGLLVLARGRAGALVPVPLDLRRIAADAADRAAGSAAGRRITLESDLAAAPVAGEPILLERAVGNLLENAVRHNHPGGEITVTTGTSAAGAFVRVVNTGRRIAPDEARGLPEPFVRGSGARTRSDGGAGLGLSIVRAVATAHAGELTVTARPGGGLEVLVSLPVRRLYGDGAGGAGSKAGSGAGDSAGAGDGPISLRAGAASGPGKVRG